MKGSETVMMYEVRVHYRNRSDTVETVYDPNSDHPKDVQQVAMEKARLVQLHAGQSARDRPTPQWAEVESEREVTVEEAE